MSNTPNDPSVSAMDDNTQTFLARMNLSGSITQAFYDASPLALRRWYVETFVMDPSNRPLLSTLKSHGALESMHKAANWVSIEHAAIGTRLLYVIKPTLIARDPDILEPEHWRNDDDVSDMILRLFTPWDTVRYDPEGENWYTAIAPGQWRRHGKGAPGCNEVEQWIKRWLADMDTVTGNMNLFLPFIPDTSKYDTDTLIGRQGAVVASFNKYSKATRTKQNLRLAMERNSIMHLDTNTLNQIRTMTPFSNGALQLVKSEYTTTAGRRVPILPGELKPLDLEYMVTNANPLAWLDDGTIPKAANSTLAHEGDFLYLIEREDNLLLHDCPTYWSFLTHAFPNPDERSAFLRLLGAAMFGTNLKIVAAMIGEPNAGKDTVINWLNYVMPQQVATLPFSAFTPYGDEDRGFAPLRGARVATVSGEVGEGRGSKLLAEKIKTVSSGGGKIRVAEKYEKPSDIWFDGMLMLQGNSVPQIVGGDRALYTNRLVAVPFSHPFPLVSRSFEDAYRREAPWFAQVLFINYLQYLYDGGGMTGVNPPAEWREFAKEFADNANPHGFLENCIVPGDKPIPTQQFHQSLSAMIGRFGSPFPVGPNYWPKRLRALGFQTKNGPNCVRRKVQRNGVATWCYYLTIESERSDGAFTQMQWENILKDAAVTA